MGWEVRHDGRLYLYRNYRENGKPVKHYITSFVDRVVLGYGGLMEYMLGRVQRRSARLRKLTRRVRVEYRARIDDLVRTTATANADLRVVAEGVLYSLGYHKHKRSEWRMKLELMRLKGTIAALEKQSAERKPLLNYAAPADDAEAVDLFAKARAGDADAQDRVRALIRERKWVGWFGDLGQQATAKLVWKAAGHDPVWEAGLIQKVNALHDQLLGENPTLLEKLLVRRVVNAWIATYALELELTLRPPANARDRSHLDCSLSRAQKRVMEAARELARVRKLAVPALLVNIANKQVNVIAPTPAISAGN